MLSGRYTLEQWEGTPRRALVSFFIWFDAANSRRAPLMYRPGSHRVVAARNTATGTDAVSRMEEGRRLPELLQTGGLSADSFEEPVPAEGPAGSVTVTTTTLVHGAATNIDDSPRFSMHLTFGAKEFVEAAYDGLFVGGFAFPRHWAELAPRLRPERRHIVCLDRAWEDDEINQHDKNASAGPPPRL